MKKMLAGSVLLLLGALALAAVAALTSSNRILSAFVDDTP